MASCVGARRACSWSSSQSACSDAGLQTKESGGQCKRRAHGHRPFAVRHGPTVTHCSTAEEAGQLVLALKPIPQLEPATKPIAVAALHAQRFGQQVQQLFGKGSLREVMFSMRKHYIQRPEPKLVAAVDRLNVAWAWLRHLSEEGLTGSWWTSSSSKARPGAAQSGSEEPKSRPCLWSEATAARSMSSLRLTLVWASRLPWQRRSWSKPCRHLRGDGVRQRCQVSWHPD